MSAARLVELSARIERLSLDPATIRDPLLRLVRLARPILHRLGWQPRIRFERFPRLMEALRDGAPGPGEALDVLLREAEQELEANVTAVERATVVNQRVLLPHAAWLRRTHDLLRRARAFHEDLADRDEDSLLPGVEPVVYLPPLMPRVRPEPSIEEISPRPAPDPTETPLPAEASPVLELQLAVVDQLVAAARAEGELLSRRRRLLEGARRSLLDVTAAVPLDPAGVEERQRFLAQQITRIDRLEAAGVVGGVRLLHQTRQAMLRGDPRPLGAALCAVRETALSRQDARTVALASEALSRLWQNHEPWTPAALEASQRASAEELLGPRVIAAILGGYQLARQPGRFTTQWADIQQRVDEYLEPGAELATLRSLLAVDGCCEVGGVLSPVRVEEQIQRQVAVRFPTPELVLMPAQDPADLPDAIIDDPRTLLLSLAMGRLLARRFVRQEPVVRRRLILQGEVRVFLLDGSGSMIGTRARVRDAILLAELATLVRRASEHGRDSRVLLYFQYFSDELGPVTKVDSPRAALAAIEEVTATMRQGGTNLQAALLASYQQIASARADDPDLSRAQIVLITDGEAPIDLDKVAEARAAVEGLPVGVSVIALGQENDVLKGLVAQQRARGERAFYQHLPDSILKEIEAGTLDGGPALHLPPELFGQKSTEQRAAELSGALSGVLDELISLERTRDTDAMERAEDRSAGLRAAGLSVDSLDQAERARLEALHQDRRALSARFDRWFPALSAAAADALLDETERALVDRIHVLLSAVADVVEFSGTELSRQRDAIEILERLLPDAGLTPASYEAALHTHRARLAPALAAVRAAVRPPREPMRAP